MASLKALLQSTKLEDVFQPRSVISFDHDTPIAIVLETLSRNRILSAPVFVRTIPGQEASVKSLLGFVDVGAVLQAFLNGKPAHPPVFCKLPSNKICTDQDFSSWVHFWCQLMRAECTLAYLGMPDSKPETTPLYSCIDVQMSKPLSSVTAADLEQAGETLYRQPVLTLFGEDVRPSQSSVMTNGSDACRDWSIKGTTWASAFMCGSLMAGLLLS